VPAIFHRLVTGDFDGGAQVLLDRPRIVAFDDISARFDGGDHFVACFENLEFVAFDPDEDVVVIERCILLSRVSATRA
jgi:hypothetical protein